MLLICLPVYLLAEPLLKLWLEVLPDYTVVFVQIIIVQSLFQVFDTSFYTALYAKGRLRENALISPTLGFVQFPLIYLLFKSGCSPVVLSRANLVLYILLGLIVKPVLLVKIADYDWHAIADVFKICLRVTIMSLPFPLLLVWHVNNQELNFGESFLCAVLIVLMVTPVVIFAGIDRNTRNKIWNLLKNKDSR